MNAHTAALDTSVIVRLLTSDPEDLAQLAFKRLKELHARGVAPVVPDLVIAEAYFALHHYYKIEKEEAVKVLHAFVSSGQVALEPGGVALEALEWPGSKPGLVDRMIYLRARAYAGEILTFDRDWKHLKHVLLLK